ncbi:hypothetical protein AAKU55_005255 [Oxalobacteraceae bacterium GrIS 1.11]
MAYKNTPGTGIVRISDGAFIPADLGNVDYASYLAWVAAGNVPLPADALEAKNAVNTPILAQLIEIDQKSIRAMRERNAERVDALEAEAAALRLRLIQ